MMHLMMYLNPHSGFRWKIYLRREVRSSGCLWFEVRMPGVDHLMYEKAVDYKQYSNV